MRCDEEGYGAGSLFLSFILGGLVGAGVALLIAPKSGEETRRRIRELADEVKDKAEGYVEQTKGKVMSSIEKGKSYVEEKKSVITAAVEAGKEAYEKEKERLAKEH